MPGQKAALSRKGIGSVGEGLNSRAFPAVSSRNIVHCSPAGGTDVAIATMGFRLDSVDAHIDYLAAISSALGRGER